MSKGLTQMYYGASDEELIQRIAGGDDVALACVLMRYKPLLKTAVYKVHVPSLDYDDLYQEATLGLVKAIKNYNNEKGPFSAFAKLCVESELVTYIRSCWKKSNIPAMNLVEFNDEFHMPLSDPQDIYLRREEIDQVRSKIKNSLSDFEFKIIHSYIMGKSYDEIAGELNVSVKSVDNAMQRIRRKLK
ncbi:MAG: sigma-70 family RNA polymerase sigma factor [Clostridia bacterium]|nr:sigma-70 family RNA polymerase sigma factor [Clostridia bacterium]